MWCDVLGITMMSHTNAWHHAGAGAETSSSNTPATLQDAINKLSSGVTCLELNIHYTHTIAPRLDSPLVLFLSGCVWTMVLGPRRPAQNLSWKHSKAKRRRQMLVVEHEFRVIKHCGFSFFIICSKPFLKLHIPM